MEVFDAELWVTGLAPEVAIEKKENCRRME